METIEESAGSQDSSASQPSQPQGSQLPPPSTPLTVRIVVDIGRIQLELYSRSSATNAIEPLGLFTIADLWVSYCAHEGGRMAVTLSLPTVQGNDLRPGVPQQHSMVISSGQGASFLSLLYDSDQVTNQQVREEERGGGRRLCMGRGWGVEQEGGYEPTTDAVVFVAGSICIGCWCLYGRERCSQWTWCLR